MVVEKQNEVIDTIILGTFKHKVLHVITALNTSSYSITQYITIKDV